MEERIRKKGVIDTVIREREREKPRKFLFRGRSHDENEEAAAGPF